MSKTCGDCKRKEWAKDGLCRSLLDNNPAIESCFEPKVITNGIKSGMDYISRQVHYITETADTIDVRYRVIYRGKEKTMTAAQIEAIMMADLGMVFETGEPILEVIDERFKRKNNR